MTHPCRRTRIALFVCAVFLHLALGACSSEHELTDEQKQKLVDNYAEQAEQYLQMGELDRAQGQTEKGLGIDPQNFRLKLIRGLTLQKRGKTDDILKAEAAFREILDSGDFRVSLGLALSLERKGVALSEASRDFESGKRVSDAPDPKKLADDLEKEAVRSWTEAVQRYTETLSAHSGDTDAMNGLVRTTALLGRDAESLSWADQLLEACQSDRTFWEQRLSRPSISVPEESYFRHLIKQITDIQVATHIHAATMLHKLNRDAEAIDHLNAALELNPEHAELYSRRAELNHDLKHDDQAIKDIDTYLRLSSQPFDHPDVKKAWRLRQDCEAALRTAETAR
jgi:tetratricopeptide (TPR) repeat protein